LAALDPTEWPHVWALDKWPRREWDYPAPGGYKGMGCRVLIRGRTMNSALVEFENGDRIIASRNGLRRRKE